MSKKNESSLGRARLRCPSLYRSFPKQESSNDELGITRVWQIIEDQESLTMDELIDEVRINILKPDYVEIFLRDIKEIMRYKQSSQFISDRLKELALSFKNDYNKFMEGKLR